MSESLLSPLTPADCDLSDFEFMPMMVRRVLKSETWALGTGDERAAAVALWFESWHQVPAASLPNNDRILARLADTSKWARVKAQALRGWVLCGDGRLYHPVVAEVALAAWLEKLLAAINGGIGNATRWKIHIDVSADVARLKAAAEMLRALDPKAKPLRKQALLKILAGSPPDVSHPPGYIGEGSAPDIGSGSPPDSPPDRNREGQGEGEGQGSTSSVPDGTAAGAPKKPRMAPKTPADEERARLWRDIKAMFVAKQSARDAKAAGELVGQLSSKYGKDVLHEAVAATLKADPIEPHTYLVSLCEIAAGKRQRLGGTLTDNQRDAANAAATQEALQRLRSRNAGGDVIDAETKVVPDVQELIQ